MPDELRHVTKPRLPVLVVSKSSENGNAAAVSSRVAPGIGWAGSVAKLLIDVGAQAQVSVRGCCSDAGPGEVAGSVAVSASAPQPVAVTTRRRRRAVAGRCEIRTMEV